MRSPRILSSTATSDGNRADLVKAGFRLDNRYPQYIQPSKGTYIVSVPYDNGREYTQYEYDIVGATG